MLKIRLFLGPTEANEDELVDQILHRILISFGLPLNLATSIVSAAKVTPSLVAKLSSALSSLKTYINSFYSSPIQCNDTVGNENNVAVNTVTVGFAMLLSLFSIVISYMFGLASMYLLVKFKKITIESTPLQPSPSNDVRNRLGSFARHVGGSQPINSSPARNSGIAASLRNTAA